MSNQNHKEALLAIANLNLFQNTNEQIQFAVSRGEKIQAAYSAWNKDKGYDIRGIKAKSNAGVGYIRLSMSYIDADGQRHYFNGALFKNDKKTGDKHPDRTGVLNLDNQEHGERLRLSGWLMKGEKAGEYLSIAISEFMTKDEVESAKAPAQAPAQTRTQAKPAAAAAPAASNAKPAARQPAARQVSAAVAAGFDDMDDDIPF